MGKRIQLSDLIEAQIISPPFTIWVEYKGHKFDAEIDQHGLVYMNGKPYTSLSVAGGTARAIVSGKPADGLSYRRVNGWVFWSYTDDQGNTHKLDTLRKKLSMIKIKPPIDFYMGRRQTGLHV